MKGKRERRREKQGEELDAVNCLLFGYFVCEVIYEVSLGEEGRERGKKEEEEGRREEKKERERKWS